MTQNHRPNWPAIWLLIISNILLPVALLTFALGFFPYKPFIPGTNQFNAADLQTRPGAPFDKVIFMVVDALRSDFVYSENSGFTFVQSLIRSGEAIPFTGHATSPTITMPRVKALTTGSIPSFLDVILNFAESDTTSTLANQDTWPLQLSLQKGGKVNMFGDDTWIKLFPKLFSRMDGTTSFFVSDFSEVDNNVTRNVPGELKREDWNGMIMHYLGLDHIGHKAGPNSPNMHPKQREMDGIVKTVYNSITESTHLSETLLVLCGDHGMNEAGNHGGSAPGETSPALVFISPKLKQISRGLPSPSHEPKDEFQYYTIIEQSDVVPTLAGLLGFPIPLNNLGVFIPDFLQFWPSSMKKKWLLGKNIEQMMGIVRPAYSGISFDRMPAAGLCDDPDTEETRLHCGYQKASQYLASSEDGGQGLEQAYKNIMSSVSSNYNMSLLSRGILLGLAAYISALTSLLLSTSSGWQATMPISMHFWIVVIQLVYGAMMFASSYVEEEQHFWYWMGSGWLLWLYLSRYPSKGSLVALAASVALLLSRIVRRWNQTGQKFAGNPDIAKNFLGRHNQLLWSLALLTYLLFFLKSCKWQGNASGTWLVAITVNANALLAGIAFKIAFTYSDAPELLEGNTLAEQIKPFLAKYTLSGLARYVFLLVFLSSSISIVSWRLRGLKINAMDAATYLHAIFSLIILTQTRLNNIPLLLLFSLQFSALKRLSLTLPEIIITIFLLQHASYFAYGGSNAISSIDLSNAYNGITGYNVLAVGLLTFLSNWSGPVWWSLAGIVLLVKHSPKNVWSSYFRYTVVLTMMVATSVVSVQIACLMLRTHLFIWTVFSPKYLYTMAWTLGQHLGVNILLSAGLLWIVQGL